MISGKAALMTLLTLGVPCFVAVAALVNVMMCFDVGDAASCEKEASHNTLLMLIGGVTLWGGVLWLLLRRWGRN